MALVDTAYTSYNWTIGLIREISDPISIIDPRNNPLLDRWGFDRANRIFDGLGDNPNTKIEWQEDEMATLSDTLDGSIASNATTITLNDASILTDGDVILIDSEYMWVSSVSGEVATVTRNFGGTQATHADTATVTIVGQARLERDDATYDVMTEPTQPYNYTNIIQAGVQVSGTELKMARYGIDDMMQYQFDKAMDRWARKFELGIFHGQRKAGSTTTPRSMGGLDTFITTGGNYSDASSAAITMTMIEDVMELCDVDGAIPNLLVCHPRQWKFIHRFYRDYVTITGGQSEGSQVGHSPVRTLVTNFGDLEVLPDKQCPNDKVYLLNEDHIGTYQLRAPAQYEVARTGDSVKGEIVGEVSLVVRHGTKAHGRIDNLATS